LNSTHGNSVAQSVILVRWLSAGFALVLLAGIIWASSATSVLTGLEHLAADRWGIVTLLDIYAGVVVVAAWIWACERRVTSWLPWVVAMLCLGHLVSLVYLFVRAMRARTLAQVFMQSEQARHKTRSREESR
jgi:hypothetical protein